MVKGCQRRIVMLRGTGSGMFEEAYFILKPEKAETPEPLMIAEANRIIEENTLSAPTRHRPVRDRMKWRLHFFLCGLCTGGGLVGLLWGIFG